MSSNPPLDPASWQAPAHQPVRPVSTQHHQNELLHQNHQMFIPLKEATQSPVSSLNDSRTSLCGSRSPTTNNSIPNNNTKPVPPPSPPPTTSLQPPNVTLDMGSWNTFDPIYPSSKQSSSPDSLPVSGPPVCGARKRLPVAKTSILERAFQENPKPDKKTRESLAQITDIPIRNIQIWFQNRRAKARSNEEENIIKKLQASYLPAQDHSSHHHYLKEDDSRKPQDVKNIQTNPIPHAASLEQPMGPPPGQSNQQQFVGQVPVQQQPSPDQTLILNQLISNPPPTTSNTTTPTIIPPTQIIPIQIIPGQDIPLQNINGGNNPINGKILVPGPAPGQLMATGQIFGYEQFKQMQQQPQQPMQHYHFIPISGRPLNQQPPVMIQQVENIQNVASSAPPPTASIPNNALPVGAFINFPIQLQSGESMGSIMQPQDRPMQSNNENTSLNIQQSPIIIQHQGAFPPHEEQLDKQGIQQVLMQPMIQQVQMQPMVQQVQMQPMVQQQAQPMVQQQAQPMVQQQARPMAQQQVQPMVQQQVQPMVQQQVQPMVQQQVQPMVQQQVQPMVQQQVQVQPVMQQQLTSQTGPHMNPQVPMPQPVAEFQAPTVMPRPPSSLASRSATVPPTQIAGPVPTPSIQIPFQTPPAGSPISPPSSSASSSSSTSTSTSISTCNTSISNACSASSCSSNANPSQTSSATVSNISQRPRPAMHINPNSANALFVQQQQQPLFVVAGSPSSAACSTSGPSLVPAAASSPSLPPPPPPHTTTTPLYTPTTPLYTARLQNANGNPPMSLLRRSYSATGPGALLPVNHNIVDLNMSNNGNIQLSSRSPVQPMPITATTPSTVTTPLTSTSIITNASTSSTSSTASALPPSVPASATAAVFDDYGGLLSPSGSPYLSIRFPSDVKRHELEGTASGAASAVAYAYNGGGSNFTNTQFPEQPPKRRRSNVGTVLESPSSATLSASSPWRVNSSPAINAQSIGGGSAPGSMSNTTFVSFTGGTFSGPISGPPSGGTPPSSSSSLSSSSSMNVAYPSPASSSSGGCGGSNNNGAALIGLGFERRASPFGFGPFNNKGLTPSAQATGDSSAKPSGNVPVNVPVSLQQQQTTWSSSCPSSTITMVVPTEQAANTTQMAIGSAATPEMLTGLFALPEEPGNGEYKEDEYEDKFFEQLVREIEESTSLAPQ